jgi:hypothetical protein
MRKTKAPYPPPSRWSIATPAIILGTLPLILVLMKPGGQGAPGLGFLCESWRGLVRFSSFLAHSLEKIGLHPLKVERGPVKAATPIRAGMLGVLLAAVLPLAASSVVLAEQLVPISPECLEALALDPFEPCSLLNAHPAEVVSSIQGELVSPNSAAASENEPSDSVGNEASGSVGNEPSESSMGSQAPAPSPSPPEVLSEREVARERAPLPPSFFEPAQNPIVEWLLSTITGLDIARAVAAAVISFAVGIAAVRLSRARMGTISRS